MTVTPHSSFRLSKEGKRLLAELSRYYGINQTGVLEWLIREKTRTIGTKVRHPSKKP